MVVYGRLLVAQDSFCILGHRFWWYVLCCLWKMLVVFFFILENGIRVVIFFTNLESWNL